MNLVLITITLPWVLWKCKGWEGESSPKEAGFSDQQQRRSAALDTLRAGEKKNKPKHFSSVRSTLEAAGF